MKTAKTGMVFLALCFASPLMAEPPEISDVVVRQRWPWSRLVDIDYVLTCDSTQRVDVAVEAQDGPDTLTLPPASLVGDLYGVKNGPRRIVWDPTQTAYTNSQMLTKFRVTLTPSAVPLYMVVDLTQSAGDAGQIEYVYPGDPRLETYGQWTNVWFGVTNDVYKTDKMVFRRVPAGSFLMGGTPPTIPVTLTKDYYIGVFEVTQRQWYHVKGSYWSPYFNNPDDLPFRPVDRASYDLIRGTAAQGGAGWPTNKGVYAESFVGKLRTKTGGALCFDLPTEAQWEIACRAGTKTLFHDGDPSAVVTGEYAYTNAWLNLLGRYKFNGGWPDGKVEPGANDGCGATNGTARVGSYLPNAWGIYDMHGNLWERCLDLYGALDTNPPPDPDGPVSNATGNRVLRGSGYRYQASASTVSARRECTQVDNYYAYGFRIALPLP
jgi:formylglycine-generating enzyme required for sulfatase activity